MEFRAFSRGVGASAGELYDKSFNDDPQDAVAEEQHPYDEIIESKLKIADEMAATKEAGEEIMLPLDNVEIDAPIDWELELPMVAGEHDLMLIKVIGEIAILQVCNPTVTAAD